MKNSQKGTSNAERKCNMSNVVEQLTPNPVTHEHGENGCCPDPKAWEMEMMHQVWAAGLHDAANCFQDALEAKWELESQRREKKNATNFDKLLEMPHFEAAKFLNGCPPRVREKCDGFCGSCLLIWLRSPVEESEE